jgi:DNA invertase Pin-like site-specific DNA recombinase
MERVIAYARVSTGEQAISGAELEAQREAMLAEAERRGWTHVTFLEDAGFSGKDLKRPGIREALEALRSGRADVLVVAKLDRLSRSLLDFAGLMVTASKQHWALIALDVNVDTTTAAGEAMANMMATFSQFERRLISQRTKDALAVKRSQGVQLGRPRLLSDEVVARIKSERAAGQTYSAIAAGLNEDAVPTAQGGRAWYPSTIAKVAGEPPRPRRRRRTVRDAVPRPFGSHASTGEGRGAPDGVG